MTPNEQQSWEQGMRDALRICSEGPLNPGVKRTLDDASVRTLVQAYHKGQEDVLQDFREAIEHRISHEFH